MIMSDSPQTSPRRQYEGPQKPPPTPKKGFRTMWIGVWVQQSKKTREIICVE